MYSSTIRHCTSISSQDSHGYFDSGSPVYAFHLDFEGLELSLLPDTLAAINLAVHFTTDMSTSTSQHHKTNLKDVAQIAVGAGALGLPVAMSEDTWDIAKEVPPANIVAMVCAALILIAGFVYASYFRSHFLEHWPLFLWRVLIIYGLTVIVSSASLTLVDQAHWFVDPYLALNQTVVVALPASFAAAIVDNLA